MSSVSTILNSLGLATRAARAGQIAITPADVEALSGAVAALGAVAAMSPQPTPGHVYGLDRLPLDRTERAVKLGGERAEIFALLAAARPDLAAWFAADCLSHDTLINSLPDHAFDSPSVEETQTELDALEQPTDILGATPYPQDGQVPGGVEVTLSIVDPEALNVFEAAAEAGAEAISLERSAVKAIERAYAEYGAEQRLTYDTIEAALARANELHDFYAALRKE